jgi:tetratricopeptide (TPR) repeat protein
MSTHTLSETDIRELAAEAAARLRAGTLSFRDVLGLTEAEMTAVAAVAESYRRKGDLKEAIAVYSLLITYDPLKASHWYAMAELQRRSGQHAVAVACYEAAALLGERDATATYRQALCLEQLGQPDLARDLLDIALSLAETSGADLAWTARARRGLEPKN